MVRSAKLKKKGETRENTDIKNHTPNPGRDDSIRRVPSRQSCSSSMIETERINFKGTPRTSSSLLSTYSHNRDTEFIYGKDNEHLSNRLNTDRFRVFNARSRRASTAQGSQLSQMTEVEYVDLNGHLLDTEKLHDHNLLPGLGGTRFFSEAYSSGEIIQSMLTSPSSPLRSPERSPMQQPMYNSGSLRQFYPNELEYANNIGFGIQERYAAVQSEPTVVNSYFLPAADCQLSHQSYHGSRSPNRVSIADGSLSPGASPTQNYMYNSSDGTVGMPASYRIVEKRGRMVVSDLLLNPVTGTPVKLKEG